MTTAYDYDPQTHAPFSIFSRELFDFLPDFSKAYCYDEITYEPCHDKTCFCDMPRTRVQISLRIRLISTYVVHCLDSIIALFAIAEISRP